MLVIGTYYTIPCRHVDVARRLLSSGDRAQLSLSQQQWHE